MLTLVAKEALAESIIRIADRLEPGLRLAFLNAAVEIRNQIDLRRLAEAYISGQGVMEGSPSCLLSCRSC